jgi:hypothetical protein
MRSEKGERKGEIKNKVFSLLATHLLFSAKTSKFLAAFGNAQGSVWPMSLGDLRSLVLLCVISLVTAAPTIHIVSESSNDVYKFAAQGAVGKISRHDTVDSALSAAATGDGLMIMADAMRAPEKIPQTDTTRNITSAQWAKMADLKLNAFVEFPASLPPSLGHSSILGVKQTLWERVVVTKGMGKLPAMALLHPHKHVDFVIFPASLIPSAELVIAKVAGYDNASYGLPSPNVTFPLLVTHGNVMLAATQLSHCRTRRFAPTTGWAAVIIRIFGFVSGGTAQLPSAEKLWAAPVTPSFSSTEPLPPDAELQAMVRGVQYYRNARLMPNAKRATDLAGLHCGKGAATSDACEAFARLAPPFQGESGDGQLGMFEGYTSDISIDGSQPMSIGMRADCTGESSASFAVRSVVTKNTSDAAVARNLLNYAHVHSGFSQPWVVGGGAQLDSQRPWASTGDSFGILAWTTNDGAYERFYKDDDARGLLGAITTAGVLKSDRWHTTIAAATLGNLRFTSRGGFGPDSGGFADRGTDDWRKTYNSEGTPSYSPHYESYQWAVYLWGYSVSGFAPLLERSQAGLSTYMRGYPTKWVPTSNGIAMQRARIILPLVFLVRANNTALHREWLLTAINGLLTRQHCPNAADTNTDASAGASGWCALTEELSHPGWAKATRVPDNSDYGTFEAPLNQENTDPVSDFLYTSNFALLGLHEAAALMSATAGDKDGFNSSVVAMTKHAEDSLTEYIVRIQAKSTIHPEVDGAFFRAFDYKKWEAWASDADIGWGAWSVESGWTQSWITIVLGLRLLNTSVWDLGQSMIDTGIKQDFDSHIATMFWQPPPPPPAPCLNASAPGVAPAGTGPRATVYFNLSSTDEALCSRNGVPVHVAYAGNICGEGNNGSKAVRWTAMHTLDVPKGLDPKACSWSAIGDPLDIPKYFGGCGEPGSAVALPSEVC